MKEESVNVPHCKKCKCKMKIGIAIENTWGGVPDFIGSTEVVTMSPAGSGKVIECWKCPSCGKSITIKKK
jgi:hypothetical protein